MIRLALVGTVLLAGCSRTAEMSPADDRTANGGLAHVLTPLEQEAYAYMGKRLDTEKAFSALQSRVKKAMANYLIDPFSAKYKDMRPGRNGAICGHVNAKNRMGAYIGDKVFVIGRDGTSVYMSDYADGIGSELYGSFAEAYLNVCASKVEAKRHAVATAPADESYDPYMTSDNMTDADGGETSSNTLADPFKGE